MVRYEKCVVSTCKHTQYDGNCRLRVFPATLERCKKWIQAVGEEDLVHIPIGKLSRGRYVCDCHFCPDDYFGKKRSLKRTAIPSKFDRPVRPLGAELMSQFPPEPTQIIPTDAVKMPYQAASCISIAKIASKKKLKSRDTTSVSLEKFTANQCIETCRPGLSGVLAAADKESDLTSPNKNSNDCKAASDTIRSNETIEINIENIQNILSENRTVLDIDESTEKQCVETSRPQSPEIVTPIIVTSDGSSVTIDSGFGDVTSA